MATPGDQGLAENDVRFELLHHDQIKRRIEVMDGRSERSDKGREPSGIGRLEASPPDVKGPALAGDAYIWKCLLDA